MVAEQWEFGVAPFQVFSHSVALGGRSPDQECEGPPLMLTDLPPEPEAEPPTLERPGRKEPLVVREHEDIVLTATLATPSVAAVTWLKDGVEIRRSKRHETASLRDTHTLTIHGAQTLDSAVYSCHVGAEGQYFPVQVEGQQGCGWSSGNPMCVWGGSRGGVPCEVVRAASLCRAGGGLRAQDW